LNSLSRHLLLELFGCDRSILDDLEAVKRVLIRAASRAGAAILKSTFHKFSPQGVSGVVLIAESHFSIHTWPEVKYAACDIFTCGERIRTDEAVEDLKRGLKAKELKIIDVKRGEGLSCGK
jgi:S-adenosylmethionine decarboxylase